MHIFPKLSFRPNAHVFIDAKLPLSQTHPGVFLMLISDSDRACCRDAMKVRLLIYRATPLDDAGTRAARVGHHSTPTPFLPPAPT